MRKCIALALTGLWLATGAVLAPAEAAPKLVKGLPLPPARPKPAETDTPKVEAPKAEPAQAEAPKSEPIKADAPRADAPQDTKTPEKAAIAEKSEEERKGWKSVKLPLPPKLDKKWRVAALKADKDKAAQDKAAKLAEKARPNATQVKAGEAKTGEVVPGIPAVTPPQPQATGIFAAFSQGNQEGSSSPSDGAVVRPPASASAFASVSGPATKVARLSLPNPLKKKTAPGIREESEEDDDEEDEADEGTTPGSIRKQVASVQTACLQPQLLAMIKKAGEHFGAEAVITSGYRSRGRRGSFHRKCAAADFQIDGVSPQQLVAYLRKMPGAGGVGTYCHTKSVHLDTGTPRDWHQCLFQRRFALRTPIPG